VGLDLLKDIDIVTQPGRESMRLLSEGKIDAYLGFPPEPQEMREQQIGHAVISSTVNQPWSQYFFCMLAGNREFVRTSPVATKRALRAIFKAADICAGEPERFAQFMVDPGYTKRYDHASRS
jgi:NitT/TauT family transport system substrate-binding protein